MKALCCAAHTSVRATKCGIANKMLALLVWPNSIKNQNEYCECLAGMLLSSLALNCY